MSRMNPGIPAREVSISFTLRDLATPLFRYKRVLLTTFLFVFGAVAFLGLAYLRRYESHMVIQVSRARLAPLATTDAANQTPFDLTDREVNSEAELIRTYDLLQKVVLANGMQNTHGGGFFHFFPSRRTEADRVERAVQALGSQLHVEAVPHTNLIKVTYRSSDPAQTYTVLKSLARLYLEKHAASRQPPVSSQAQNSSQRELEQALDRTESVAIAVPPDVPVRPAPGPVLLLFIALAAAVLVSVPATYAADYFDPSFRTPAEVIDILGVGVVVDLPKRIA
jgi:uncharacterized protein involved in exopolysaccharide biosynthesis